MSLTPGAEAPGPGGVSAAAVTLSPAELGHPPRGPRARTPANSSDLGHPGPPNSLGWMRAQTLLRLRCTPQCLGVRGPPGVRAGPRGHFWVLPEVTFLTEFSGGTRWKPCLALTPERGSDSSDAERWGGSPQPVGGGGRKWPGGVTGCLPGCSGPVWASPPPSRRADVS